jgi:hypothetical protein
MLSLVDMRQEPRLVKPNEYETATKVAYQDALAEVPDHLKATFKGVAQTVVNSYSSYLDMELKIQNDTRDTVARYEKLPGSERVLKTLTDSSEKRRVMFEESTLERMLLGITHMGVSQSKAEKLRSAFVAQIRASRGLK